MSDCVVLCCVAVTLCGTRRLLSILLHEYAEAIAAHRARVDNIRSLAASVATVEDGGMPAEMATQLQAVRQRGFLRAKHDVFSVVCCYIFVTCHRTFAGYPCALQGVAGADRQSRSDK